MRDRMIPLAIVTGLLVSAAPTFADHNSRNGEGWASMPNDIHNTRVETLENNDNDAFREFVKYGEGSKSVNRFASDDTRPTQASKRQGKAERAANQGDSVATATTEVRTRAERKNKTGTATRSRIDHAVAAPARSQRSASFAGNGGSRNRSGRR